MGQQKTNLDKYRKRRGGAGVGVGGRRRDVRGLLPVGCYMLMYLRDGSAQTTILRALWDRSSRSNRLPHSVTVY